MLKAEVATNKPVGTALDNTEVAADRVFDIYTLRNSTGAWLNLDEKQRNLISPIGSTLKR